MASVNPIVDPNDKAEMQIFAAACVLAKHLQYAAGEAFHSPIDATTTPVSLWAVTRGANKDWWILRAMEVLRTFNPRPIASRPSSGKVLEFNAPAPALGEDSAPSIRVDRAGEAIGSLCIYCTDRHVEADHDPYCSAICAINASNEGD